VESDETSPVVEEVRVPEVSRDTKVYFPSQANFDPSQFELPEEFYDMTPEDYARLIEEQSRKQKEMEIENSVLMTKQSRDYFKSKKQKKYKKCMLRIRFPDRTILEGTFHPLNKIRDVEDYVRQNLLMNDLPFYLYISPPVQKFTDTNATLRQSNLVPATVINFALKDGAINGDQDTFFLKPELLDQFRDNTLSDGQSPIPKGIPAVNKAKGPEIMLGSTTTTKSASQRNDEGKQSESNESGSSSGVSKKGPKWFKSK